MNVPANFNDLMRADLAKAKTRLQRLEFVWLWESSLDPPDVERIAALTAHIEQLRSFVNDRAATIGSAEEKPIMSLERKTAPNPLPSSVPAEAPDPSNAPAFKTPKVATPRDGVSKPGYLFGTWGD